MHGLLNRPRLLLGLCALFWAGNFVLGRAMHEAVPPVGLAFWRWAVASLLVLPFVLRPLCRQWGLLRSRFFRLSLLALLGVAGFNTFVYLGLQTTTATNSVLIQSTMPVQILLLNWLMFRARVGGFELLSILLSLSGAAVIVSAGSPLLLLEGGWNRGDLWIVGASAIWALYSVLLRWRPDGLDPRAFLGFILLVGCAALFPFYLLENGHARPMSWNLPVVLTVAYVAIFPSALAYLFWNRAVTLIGANAAGHFIHLMPVFGSLMAVAFLGEVFAWYHAVGATLVAAGILLMLLKRHPGSRS